MKTGILVITHSPIGHALNEVAMHVLGASPDAVTVMDIHPDTPFETAVSAGSSIAEEMNEGQGVVIFTDCFGATPANIALKISKNTAESSLVTGLNLPMLLRAINYQDQKHSQLAQTAIEGGIKGACQMPTDQS